MKVYFGEAATETLLLDQPANLEPLAGMAVNVYRPPSCNCPTAETGVRTPLPTTSREKAALVLAALVAPSLVLPVFVLPLFVPAA